MALDIQPKQVELARWDLRVADLERRVAEQERRHRPADPAAPLCVANASSVRRLAAERICTIIQNSQAPSF